MGLLSRRRWRRLSSAAAEAKVAPASLAPRRPAPPDTPSGTPLRLSVPAGIEPVELPGADELQVAGESFHADAILAAELSASPRGLMTAVLMPDPGNPHDRNAVAVYLEGWHVGYLPREVAPRMQPALLAFSEANGGRPVGCRGVVNYRDGWTWVVLYIDLAPLSVDPREVETVPDLDQAIQRLLPRLDALHPALIRTDLDARHALDAAEHRWVIVDADYSRDSGALRGVEEEFRSAAEMLARADDPLVSKAWLGVARAARYQRDRREGTLEAFVEALRWDRANADAWAEFLDYASSAPHVPTLVALFERVPPAWRPPILRQLITLSRGQDRLGRMSPSAGERLRAELLAFARSQGDEASCAILAGRRRK